MYGCMAYPVCILIETLFLHLILAFSPSLSDYGYIERKVGTLLAKESYEALLCVSCPLALPDTRY